jgi:hypothetical protein
MDIVEEVEIMCPHCGEAFTIEVETTQPRIEMVEDCAVCCAPIALRITCEPGAVVDVQCAAS